MGAGTALTAIASAAAAFFGWRSSKVEQRRSAERDARKAAAQRQSEAAKIDRSVYTGDADAVNSHLSDILKVLVIAASLAAGTSGCRSTKTVYVPADRACRPATNETGIAGWFVPNATFADLLKAAQRARALEIERDAKSTTKE